MTIRKTGKKDERVDRSSRAAEEGQRKADDLPPDNEGFVADPTPTGGEIPDFVKKRLPPGETEE